MLGAVAAGALLGAARGTYTIDLDNQETGDRTDDEYKVVTTEGLEIVIGPSAGTSLDIEVVGGLNTPGDGDFASCPGGYTLDATSGVIVCYDVARGLQDTSVEVTEGKIDVTGGENTSDGDFDWTQDCRGDIDVKITGEIVCSDGDGNGLIVTNTDTGSGTRTFIVSGKDSAGTEITSFDVN